MGWRIIQHRKYLRFIWGGKLFQCTCQSNGLSSVPRYFTKLLKPVYGYLVKNKGNFEALMQLQKLGKILVGRSNAGNPRKPRVIILPQGKYEDREEGTRWEHSTGNDLRVRVMGIKQRYEKLAVAQRKLERIILDITVRYRKRHTWIRQETGVSNIVNIIRVAKHRWTGHIARLSERLDRKTRWRDDLTRQLGPAWSSLARDRYLSMSSTEQYTVHLLYQAQLFPPVVREKGQLLFVCPHSPSLFLDLHSQFQMKNFPYVLAMVKGYLHLLMDTVPVDNKKAAIF
ncbi:hypothetical protein P5673_026446 [Acropora cervicornis]|uniref:Uncharacterized protein n=1 Tax=Acropora cervicornis TaxID=6130 RepID=A0AAD9Q107_ACRCE|nr:hypothetical protein P5673_026446 [Acropora cervicornis]